MRCSACCRSALHSYKIGSNSSSIVLLVALNLRGMKEAIKFLLPIFIGFVIVHVVLIVYGICAHVGSTCRASIPETLQRDRACSRARPAGYSWSSTILLAYSQGGGTYTGIEAVSNNVNTLAEPRVATGKWTMFYMATVARVHGRRHHAAVSVVERHAVEPGQTLNAVVFKAIIDELRSRRRGRQQRRC